MKKFFMLICFLCFLLVVIETRNIDVKPNDNTNNNSTSFIISNYYNEVLDYEDDLDKIGFDYYDQYLIRRFVKHSKYLNTETTEEYKKHSYEIKNKDIDDVLDRSVKNKDEINTLIIYTDLNNNLIRVTYDFSNYIDEYTKSDTFKAELYFKVNIDEKSNIN